MSNVLIFFASLSAALISSTGNKITAMASSTTPAPVTALFSVSMAVFALNLLFTILLFVIVKPQSYLISSTKRYNSNGEIVSDFINVLLRTHASFGDMPYSVYLFNLIKNNKTRLCPSFAFVKIISGKDSDFKIMADSLLESVDERAIINMLQLLVDGFNTTKSNEDVFLQMLKHNIEPILLQTLVRKGLVV